MLDSHVYLALFVLAQMKPWGMDIVVFLAPLHKIQGLALARCTLARELRVRGSSAKLGLSRRPGSVTSPAAV